MQVIYDIAQWLKIRKQFNNNCRIGFVPTMGCLHRGHAELLKRSTKENDTSIMSLYINPTQFNEGTDFNSYPKTPEHDLDLAKKIGIDYVLIPSDAAMYPSNNSISLTCSHPAATIMEGNRRPGHFNGMLTVVFKLLQLTRPSHLYCGEKDYQQYLLIQSLVEQFFIDTKIIPCQTVRETSGLACSSRNKNLSTKERVIADEFARHFQQYPRLEKEPLLQHYAEKNIQVEYLQEFKKRIFIAAKINQVRLIDNIALGEGV